MMIPTPNWDVIKDLFDQALDLDTDQRTHFLDELGADKPELAHELRQLLAEVDHTPTFFEQDAVQALGFAVKISEPIVALPERIGIYRVIREIGQGGMGRVYLATRDDGQFDKTVAIKVVKRGMDTDDILTRFRYERQILASLEHPNIAQLFDGGLTEDGRPYFVLEYVDGEPITDYADRKQLTVSQRLALFRTVCRAVQYAHQSLIIHRDLKPSNIMVTEDGTIKLLDFGIAKLLDEEQANITTPITEEYTRLLTPEYAAPEQVQGAPITTATDVYQLGVVLYELLTGRRPYHINKRIRHEVERIILEQEPTRPSTAVTRVQNPGVEQNADTTGSDRGMSIEALQRALKGDLDMICLKALAKEQRRRYGGVGALAEDIRRYQNGLPVLAQPDSLRYRVRKFVKRHKVGVAAGSMIGMLVLMVALMAISFALVTAEQNKLLSEERDRVTEERNQAEAVRAFVVDLFEVNDPDVSGTKDISARTLLERGTMRVREELAEQPEVQSEMLIVLSQVYHKLSDFKQSRQLIEEAIALQRSHLGDTDPLVGETMGRLASTLDALGNYPAADSAYQEALRIFEAAHGREHASVASALSNLATIRSYQSKLDEAATLMKEAAAIQEAVSEPHSRALADTYYNAGIVYQQGGDIEAAAEAFRRVLELDRIREGTDSFDVINSLIQLGRTLSGQPNTMDEGKATLEEALAIAGRILDPQHRLHAMIHTELGNLYYSKQNEKALRHYEQALAVHKVNFGEIHPDVAGVTHSIANVLVGLEEWQQADSLYQQALHVAETVFDGAHPDVALILRSLAYARGLRGLYDDADVYFAQAIAMYDEILPEQDGRRYRARQLYGEILLFAGRYPEAETILLTSYNHFEEVHGIEDWRTQGAIKALADLYKRWGKTDHQAFYQTQIIQDETH